MSGAPPLPRERPLPGDAHRHRRHRPAEQHARPRPRMVTVNAPPEPVIAAPAAVCPGEVAAFDARQLDAMPTARSRASPGASATAPSAEGAEVSHACAAPGRYPLTLIADDGCGPQQQPPADRSSTSTSTAPPRPMAGPDRAVCPGEEVTLRRRRLDRLGRRARRATAGTSAMAPRAEGAQVAHAFAAARHLRGPACGHRRLRRQLLAPSTDVARVLRQRAAGRGRRRRPPGLRRRRLRPAAVRRLGLERCRRPAAELPLGPRRRRRRAPASKRAPRLRRARRLHRCGSAVSDGTGLACGQTSDELTVEVREPRPAAGAGAGSGQRHAQAHAAQPAQQAPAVRDRDRDRAAAGRRPHDDPDRPGRAQELGQRAAAR